MKDYVDNLRELSRLHVGSTLSEETRCLVSELKSSVLRHTSPTHAFCILGGPQLLLQLLSQCACAGQDAVLLLGLLGNLCALDKSSRDIVSAHACCYGNLIVRSLSCMMQVMAEYHQLGECTAISINYGGHQTVYCLCVCVILLVPSNTRVEWPLPALHAILMLPSCSQHPV